MSLAIGTPEYTDAANEALVKIDRWLWQLAGQYCRRVGLSSDEFHHELTIRVFLSYHTYRPSAGALTTWAEWQCRRLLTDLTRAAQRHREFTVSHDADLVDFLGNVPAPAEPEAPTGPTPAERASRALDKLRPRVAQAMRLRFGFDGEARTLDVVGKEMGVSKERVRQLVGKGLERLREELVGV